MKRVFILLSCFLLLVGCQSSAPPTIPNFATVAPGIFRGGQPTDRGWWQLRLAGVTNVVKLDMVDEGADNGAVKQGMMVHYFPLSFQAQTFGPVPQGMLDGAVTNISPGTYVHCLHGQDRTGLVIGLFRVHSGWTKSRAEAEMLNMGFHKELHGLWDYWEDNVR